MKKEMIIVLIVAAFLGSSYADHIWTGNTSSQWADGSNWDLGTAPGTSTIVRINYGANACTISDGGSYEVSQAWILRYSASANDAVLNLVDGSLRVTGYQFNMGDGYGSGISPETKAILNIENDFALTVDQRLFVGKNQDAIVNINGGSLTVNDYFKLGGESGRSGDGTLNVTDGQLSVNNFITLAEGDGSVAQINMNGGEITTNILTVGGSSNTTGSAAIYLTEGIVMADSLQMNNQSMIDITGGTLLLQGDVSDATVFGNVLAYSGEGTLAYSYDSQSGYTAISAVPEPATMALLGLGGILAYRKRK